MNLIQAMLKRSKNISLTKIPVETIDSQDMEALVRYEAQLATEASQKNPRIPRKKGQPAGSDKHSDLYTDEEPRGNNTRFRF